MSNNDMMRENNKKLFESRLQMKPNSSLKINQISLKTNKNKLKNKTNLYLFNTDIFQHDISQSKRKNKSGMDNSLNNFLNKNISAGKKQKKINKNRNKNNYLKISNKSNLIIKDISFFRTKNPTLKNDIQIINVNKKGTTHNNSSKKIQEQCSNSNQRRNDQLKNALNLNIKKQKRINQDKYSKSFLDFTYDNNNKQKISKSKVTLVNNIHNVSMKKRNSSSNKKDDIYKSFLVQKIKIIKKKKKPYLNNVNFNLGKNNKSIRSNLLNKTGKNIKDSFYQNCNEKYERITYRNLFLRKGLNPSNKNSFINLNYNTNANNSSLFNNKKKVSERNLKIKNINRLTINPGTSKISQNKINDIHTITKIKINNDINKNLKMNRSKNAKTAKEININQNMNNNNLSSKNNKYIDKKEEIIDDFNIKSTKTNDDVFTESKNEKIDETSIEEESGILSMNEIEDIIIYNNMKDINKDDKYLFKKNDYDDFINEYKDKILSLFFDVNNKKEEKINKEINIKINSDKKINELKKEKSGVKNKNKIQNKSKEFKIFSYNNSFKKKKQQFSHK